MKPFIVSRSGKPEAHHFATREEYLMASEAWLMAQYDEQHGPAKGPDQIMARLKYIIGIRTDCARRGEPKYITPAVEFEP